MPTEKNTWDIAQLQEKVKEAFELIKDHEGRMKAQETFKAATIEKLIVIFQKLEELQEGDRWIKRAFVVSLIGAVLSAISALIVWAIQN